ncbi:integrase [Pseudomonas protegens]|nr:integrase [Pseudomonas protegens]
MPTIQSITGMSREELQARIEHTQALPYGQARLKIRELMVLGLSGDANIDIPNWLIEGTNFYSNIWRCGFGVKSDQYKKTINFNVLINDGSLLSDTKNIRVLNWFKYLICVQIHPRYNRGSRKQAHTEARRVTNALQFIDWILLNDDVFNIGKYGLTHVTVDGLKGYLTKKTLNPVSHYLYDYGNKLTLWFNTKIDLLCDEDYQEACRKWPQITVIPKVTNRIIHVSDDSLRKARAIVRIENMFWVSEGGGRFNDRCFIEETYKNTLHGLAIATSTPEELRFPDTFSHEYPQVPVSAPNRHGVVLSVLAKHVIVVRSTLIINSNYVDAGLNTDGISELDAADLYKDTTQKANGRFSSLPAPVMVHALGSSIEFILRYGQDILNSVISVFAYMLAEKLPSFRRVSKLNKFVVEMSSECLQELAVKAWRIRFSRFPNASYFDELRQHPGLFELYHVLLGSILTALGSLTARRQSEIIELSAKGCLLPFKNPNLPENAGLSYRLVYHAAKTGNRQKRQKLYIGITTPLAKMLWMFIEFRKSCEDMGLMSSEAHLFFVVKRVPNKTYKLTAWRYNDALDIACEYFQSPTVVLDDGVRHRYYIRQHQLRRFFAMSFFWSSGFDGLDTLRYALGHADVEHIYRYITETTPGKVLQSIKVERVCDSILHGTCDLENLGRVKTLLAEKFDGLDIVIKTADEIAEDYGSSLGAATFITVDTLTRISMEANLYNEVLQLFQLRIIDLQPEFFDYIGVDGITSHRFNLVIKVKGE